MGIVVSKIEGEAAFLEQLAQKLTILEGKSRKIEREQQVVRKTLSETLELFRKRREQISHKAGSGR